MAQLVFDKYKVLVFDKPRMVAHTYNPSIREVEAGVSNSKLALAT